MIKYFLLVVVILSGGASASAQQWKAGIDGGLSWNNLLVKNGPESFNYPQAGFQIGAFVEMPVTNHIDVLVGGQFSRKGFHSDLPLPADGTERARNLLSYIGAPIVVQYNLGKGFALQSGIELNYLADARIKSKSVEANLKGTLQGLRNWDTGLLAGLVFELQPGLFIKARYVLGLTPVLSVIPTDDQGGILPEASFHNSSLQLSLGYKFGI